MASYQAPPDPSEPVLRPGRPRREQSAGVDMAAVIGFTLGVVVTLAALFLVWQALRAFLASEPPPAAVPTIVRLTAPPTTPPTPTPFLALATAIPTLTPSPTPDLATPPPTVTQGFYAAVANTGGIGVIVRGGPGTSQASLRVAEEGSLGLVIAGPQPKDGLTWWQIRFDDGTEGWVAADFLAPAGEPTP